MDHFTYRQGRLHAAEVALERIADAVGTPFYVYSTATPARHYRVLDEALAGTARLIAFPLTSHTTLAVTASLSRLRAGAGRGVGGGRGVARGQFGRGGGPATPRPRFTYMMVFSDS